MIRRLLVWSPLILFTAIVTILLLKGPGGLANHSASLRITNNSGVEITAIVTSLDDSVCAIERLAPGESGQCRFRVDADSHYEIAWTEAQATAFSERAGYVTSGFDLRHQLEFLGGGRIDFKFEEGG